ncbi:hypothetical protein BBP40_004842 [Aspergillus hancockii]|nr:hypothetical protein BBP40_004842 [Aspergillus hancockii]
MELSNTVSTKNGRSKSRKILIEVALCLVCALIFIDTVIVSTALPSIARKLQASGAQYAWVASSYLLALASLLPLWAKLSDIFGRKLVMLVGNALFLLGSLISALSERISMLIAGRGIQGAGAGALVVLSNICIADMFSLRERGLYLGILGATTSISTAVGPVLGGVFTETIGWQWCFWINLPIGGLVLVMLVAFLDVHNPKTGLTQGLRAIDWAGAVTITGATLMFVLGLQFGGLSYPWNSAVVVCLIVFGILGFLLFMLLQWKISPQPVIPHQVFSQRTNIAVLIVCFCHGIVFHGSLYYLSVYFQLALGASPIHAGVWLLVGAVTLTCVSMVTGIITKTVGRYREIISISCFFLTLGLGLWVDFPFYRSWPRIILFQIIPALGAGPLYQAPFIAIQARAPPADVAAATSACTFVRMIGASIGLIIGQVLLSNHIRDGSPRLEEAGVPSELILQLRQNFTVLARGMVDKLTVPQQVLIRQLFSSALRNVWITYTATSALALVSSFFVEHRELSRDHVETRTGLPHTKSTEDGDASIKPPSLN